MKEQWLNKKYIIEKNEKYSFSIVSLAIIGNCYVDCFYRNKSECKNNPCKEFKYDFVWVLFDRKTTNFYKSFNYMNFIKCYIEAKKFYNNKKEFNRCLNELSKL
jgi:hypothetical protein